MNKKQEMINKHLKSKTILYQHPLILLIFSGNLPNIDFDRKKYIGFTFSIIDNETWR